LGLSLEEKYMRDALKFLGGSVAVYLVMAACSSHVRNGDDDDDSSGHLGSAGRSTGAGGLAQNGGNGDTGASGGSGMMGASGRQEGAGGVTGGSGGTGPKDGGMLDAMVDAMTDPVPDASAQETSGTRLKARYYVGDDGSKQFAGWYDTERKENCTFSTASDGAIRCVPAATAAAVGSYFADSACKQPLATVSCGAPAPKYASAYSQSSGGCLMGPTLAPVGAHFTAATVYVGSSGSCTGIATPASTDWYQVGASIDPASFVRATEMTVD
jgi:hypothetical protein